MKVRCNGYKTCFYKDKCYHSIEHELLENNIIDSYFHKGASKCETNHYQKDCNCSSVNLRQEKLKKLNENN